MIIWLILGGLILLAFLWGLRAFERAPVSSIKALVAWVAALGGISLALLLVLTGRGGLALSGLLLFGPLLWQQWKGSAGPQVGNGADNRRGAGGGRSGFEGFGRRPNRASGSMSREEAYEVLGLRPGAPEAQIRAAHKRLMRGAHPDAGGSDWLAARINQARDVLLG